MRKKTAPPVAAPIAAPEHSARNENAAPAVGRLEIMPPRGIVAFRLQPRKHFDPQALAELAADIKQNGLINPPLVRPITEWIVEPGKLNGASGFFITNPALVRPDGTYSGDRPFYIEERNAVENVPHYELVAGERRWRASLLAEMELIPCMVRELTDVQALEIAIAENEKRHDVNAIESAQSYRALADLGVKQSDIGNRIGKSQPAVANALRLLELPSDVQQLIIDGTISQAHGVALCRFKEFPAFVSWYAAKAVKVKLNSKQVEGGLVLSQWEEKATLEKANLAFSCGYAGSNDSLAKRGLKDNPGAFFLDNSNAVWCLDSGLYKRLKAEDDRAEKEREEKRQAQMAAKVGEGKTFKTSDLNSYQYKNLDDGYNAPPVGCSNECPCRAVALNSGGKRIPICTDPARFAKLGQAQAREEKKIKQEKWLVTLTEARRLIDDEIASGEPGAAITLAVFQTLRNCDNKVMQVEALAIGVELDWAKWSNQNTTDRGRYEMLFPLGTSQLVRLAARASVAHQVNKHLNNDWYKTHGVEAFLAHNAAPGATGKPKPAAKPKAEPRDAE